MASARKQVVTYVDPSTYERLRSEANPIPIMLISGDLTADVVEKAERIGINLISEKPPVLKALSGFIDSALA